jgi:hypothetical protein
MILKEVKNYIASTYDQHYVGTKDIQTLDVWENLDMAEQMCLGTLLKYAMRFGKKRGKNKTDLLKLIHYAILTYHFAFLGQEKAKPGSANTTVDERIVRERPAGVLQDDREPRFEKIDVLEQLP